MKYNGFISYKHGADDPLAHALEKGLEKFAKPTFRRRALEIFRDGNDLSAAADLGEKIRDGLQQSEYFICLASPEYAQSKWCRREAEYWREHKAVDQFLIVLTKGEILWDDASGDFDWEQTTALPRELSGMFKGVPFYIDFRDAGPEETLSLDHEPFRTRLVLLAATLHGKSVGDMSSEAARQHRRTLRIRNAAIAVLSTLLLLALGMAWYANRQKNRALLSQYISLSQAQFGQDPTLSVRLAQHAYQFAARKEFPTKEAAEQLIRVFYSGKGFYTVPAAVDLDFTEPEPGRYAAYPEVVALADSLLQTLPADPYLSNASDLYIDPATGNGILVASATALRYSRIFYLEYGLDGYTTAFTDILIPDFSGYTGYIQDIDISPDGKTTLLGAANGKTALIDNQAYRYQADKNRFKDRALYHSGVEAPIREVAFTDQGRVAVTRSFTSVMENGRRQDGERHEYFYRTHAFPYVEMVNLEDNSGAVSRDGQYTMVPQDPEADPFTWFHFAHDILMEDSVLASFPDALGAGFERIDNADGSYFLNYQGIFNAEGDLLIALDLDIIDNPGIALCFSQDGRFAKVSYLDGVERIFCLDPEWIMERISQPEAVGPVAPLSEDEKERFMIQE